MLFGSGENIFQHHEISSGMKEKTHASVFILMLFLLFFEKLKLQLKLPNANIAFGLKSSLNKKPVHPGWFA